MFGFSKKQHPQFIPASQCEAVTLQPLGERSVLVSVSFTAEMDQVVTNRFVIKAQPEQIFILLEGDSVVRQAPDFTLQVQKDEQPSDYTIQVRRTLHNETTVSEVWQQSPQATVRYITSLRGYCLQTIEGFLPLDETPDCQFSARSHQETRVSIEAERGSVCATHSVEVPANGRVVGVRYDSVMGASSITFQWTEHGFPTGVAGDTVRIVDIQTSPDVIDGTFVMSTIAGEEIIEVAA